MSDEHLVAWYRERMVQLAAEAGRQDVDLRVAAKQHTCLAQQLDNLAHAEYLERSLADEFNSQGEPIDYDE